MSHRLAYRLRHAGQEIPVYDDDAIFHAGHCVFNGPIHVNGHSDARRWHETLLHELMHAAENAALLDGDIPACATEQYVEQVGKRLFALLWDNGFYCPPAPAYAQVEMDFEEAKDA